eukprot:UN11635
MSSIVRTFVTTHECNHCGASQDRTNNRDVQTLSGDTNLDCASNGGKHNFQPIRQAYKKFFCIISPSDWFRRQYFKIWIIIISIAIYTTQKNTINQILTLFIISNASIPFNFLCIILANSIMFFDVFLNHKITKSPIVYYINDDSKFNVK